MSSNLVSHFANAGLELRLADSPFTSGRNAESIFQLDIRRARPHDVRSEHFLAWSGAVQNRAAVQGVDRSERQLVLVVREGATDFEETVPARFVRTARQLGEPGSVAWRTAIAERAGVSPDRVVARTGGASIVRATNGSTRHMLVGRDERQLFMCQLPRACTTVRQAHDALRTPAARSRSRSALERPIRQGEWFFLVATTSEIEELERKIGGNRIVVRHTASINAFIPRSGKPHVADEIVADMRPGGAEPPRVYVRGAVRHPDHKTIHLRQWRRVVRNQLGSFWGVKAPSG